MKRIVALAIMLTLVTSFSGCYKWIMEKITEKAIESGLESEGGGDVDIDMSTGEYSITDKEGNEYVWGEDAEMPDQWPSDIPVNEDWPLTGSSTSSYEGSLDLSITQTCEDCTSDDVMEFYRSALGGEGWEEYGYYESSSADWGDSASVSFDSADGLRSVWVNYSVYVGGDISIYVSYTEYEEDYWSY